MSAASLLPRLKLCYFPIHGLAARIRLALLYAEIPFEDYRFAADRSDFMAMKASGELPFGQAPLLVVGEGESAIRLAQSSAILRYVCQLGRLYPADALAAAAVDASVCAEGDAFSFVSMIKYRDRSGLAHLSAADIEAAEKALSEAIIPRHLGHLDRQLAASATGWICGTEKPAACDFAWGSQLREIKIGAHAFLKRELLDAVPAVSRFVDRFLALPAIAAYYARDA